MIDLKATIAAMKEAGMDDASIVAALACVRSETIGRAEPTARQLRNKRYYDAKASERRLKASKQDGSDAGAPFPKESPQTPKETPLSVPTTPKEKTPKGVQKKAVRLPDDWVLPQDWAEWAISRGLPDYRVTIEAESMANWAANAGSKGAKSNWFRAWQNWVIRAIDALPRSRPPPSKAPSLADVFELAGRMQNERSAEDLSSSRTLVPHLSVAGQGR